MPPRPRIERPPAELLTPERVRALLVWMSPHGQVARRVVEGVPELVAAAELHQHPWATEIWFPDGTVLPFRLDARCNCGQWRDHGLCEHVATIVMISLWQREEGRAIFERPSWQLELEYLVNDDPSPLASGPAATVDERSCRIAVDLYPSGGYPLGFDFDMQLLRRSKRGHRWLKPIRCPSERDKLLAKAKPSAAQLRVHELLSLMVELRAVDTFARKTPKLRSRVVHDLIGALVDAGEEVELSWSGRAISVSREAWTPKLRVTAREGEAETLEIQFEEAVIDCWDLDPPVVLTGDPRVTTPETESSPDPGEDLVLRPVDSEVPSQLLARVGSEPVVVARSEFDELARSILSRARIPVEIPEPARVGAAAVRRREARLYLEERGAILRCSGKLGYELADGRVVEIPVGRRSTITVGESLTLVRDESWERARREELERHLGGRASVELIAEDAWTFLIEGLADLRDRGWTVFGEAALRQHRVLATPLAPRAWIGPSTDWFELQVDFRSEGGEALPAAEVIESWIGGERFVRLADERVAALPGSWLDRHGPQLAELVELGRDAGGARLGAHALPLATELLDELITEDPEQHARARHWRGRAQAMSTTEGVSERPPPPGLGATLRPYQLRGYAWLCFLRDQGLGACLADDMGLGKTVQALALLLDTHGHDPDAGGPPSLIVCPTSVIDTWREQAQRFVPDLRLHVHHGPGRGEPPAGVHLIVTSYALLRHDAELWRSRRFRHLILDEAQALKNPDSQRSRVARELEVAHAVALTGTPFENDLLELWSLFEVLMPGFFGSRRGFRRRWLEPIQKHEDAATLARLRRRLRPFMLRRLKREVANELPPKQTQVLRCHLGPAQRSLYERVRQSYRASVFGAVGERGIRGATLHILEALTRLRQACCHPRLLPFPEAQEIDEDAAKIQLLLERLEAAIADGHRSLVFSQWPSFLDLVAQQLRAANLAHLRLDGRTRDRPALLERWRDPSGPPVFLISTKAGGLGLNLTEADHVFHLDPWWNPAAEDQASDRAHRIGQDRPVMVYKIVAADTVEDKILELQARKRRLFAAAVDMDRLVVDELSRDDLEAVFADPAGRRVEVARAEADRGGQDPPPPSWPMELEDAPSPAPGPIQAEGEARVIELFPKK